MATFQIAITSDRFHYQNYLLQKIEIVRALTFSPDPVDTTPFSNAFNNLGSQPQVKSINVMENHGKHIFIFSKQ